jgi:hypothetical protein
MQLQKELETYQRELPRLLDKTGKYVLICGDKVESVWETFADALQEGYNVFGLQPFMVKQIQPVEPVHYITRDVRPVCQS